MTSAGERARAFGEATYFTAFDGIRGLAVLLVVAFHVRGEAFGPIRGLWGVTAFFVLSGFLITELALREEDRAGRVDLPGFFIRRATRILPLYALVLAGYVVAVLLLDLDDRRDAFVEALPYYVAMLPEVPIFADGNRPFGVAWSLGIEEKFYVVWPLLAFGLAATIRNRVALALGLGVTCWAAWLGASFGELLVHYVSILVGALLALLLHGDAASHRLRVLFSDGVSTVGIMVAVVIASGAWEPGRYGTLVFALAVVAVLPAVASGAGPWAGLFRFWPLRRLGEISYAVYLVHQPLLNRLDEQIAPREGPLDEVAILSIGLAATIAACVVLRHTVEQPIVRYGRRLARARRERSSVSLITES